MHYSSLFTHPHYTFEYRLWERAKRDQFWGLCAQFEGFQEAFSWDAELDGFNGYAFKIGLKNYIYIIYQAGGESMCASQFYLKGDFYM